VLRRRLDPNEVYCAYDDAGAREVSFKQLGDASNLQKLNIRAQTLGYSFAAWKHPESIVTLQYSAVLRWRALTASRSTSLAT
jgi:hypothetical protein